MSQSRKKKSDNGDWAQQFVDNLNRNVVLDHINAVEQGNMPPDEEYFRLKKLENEKKTSGVNPKSKSNGENGQL